MCISIVFLVSSYVDLWIFTSGIGVHSFYERFLYQIKIAMVLLLYCCNDKIAEVQGTSLVFIKDTQIVIYL